LVNLHKEFAPVAEAVKRVDIVEMTKTYASVKKVLTEFEVC
jgi:hypothetical protein